MIMMHEDMARAAMLGLGLLISSPEWWTLPAYRRTQIAEAYSNLYYGLQILGNSR